MRVAIIADPIDEQYAGVHIYAREVISSLLRHDTHNQYVFIHTKENPFFDGTEHYIIPNNRSVLGYAGFRLFYFVPKLIRKLKVDAVWDMGHSGPFNLPRRIKRINTIHDLTPVLMPEMHTKASAVIHKLFLPFITKRSDLLITYSRSTAKDLCRLYPWSKDKVTMIPLGKDSMFVPNSNQKVLATYHIKSPYFLYIGTLEPRKNVLLLIEAYDLWRAQCAKSGDENQQKFQLVLAGKKGWKYEATLKRIEESPYRDDIILTDYVKREDMPALYTQAEIFIFPSIYEGFGLPLLEAMACGAVCISSNASSLPEVGGEAVLYVNPYKPHELALAMHSLVKDKVLYQRMRQAALAQARLFSWDEYAKSIMTLFHKLEDEKK